MPLRVVWERQGITYRSTTIVSGGWSDLVVSSGAYHIRRVYLPLKNASCPEHTHEINGELRSCHHRHRRYETQQVYAASAARANESAARANELAAACAHGRIRGVR